MKKEEFFALLSDVDERYVAQAHKLRQHTAWLKWAASAACFCFVLLAVLSVYPATESAAPEMPMAPATPSAPAEELPPHVTVEGKRYFISPSFALSDSLPEGFVFGGTADVSGWEDCPYYVNPQMPEWVYVYQEVCTDGTIDKNNVLNQTPPHMAYVRYVDERLRGKDLLCYEGQLYISMWSVDCWGENPDTDEKLYDEIYAEYEIRMEDEDIPEGFVSVGVAQFSGKDSIPRGKLHSNQGQLEVLCNPADERVVLVESQWYTAVHENGTVPLHGYDVYLRYDGTLK